MNGDVPAAPPVEARPTLVRATPGRAFANWLGAGLWIGSIIGAIVGVGMGLGFGAAPYSWVLGLYGMMIGGGIGLLFGSIVGLVNAITTVGGARTFDEFVKLWRGTGLLTLAITAAAGLEASGSVVPLAAAAGAGGWLITPHVVAATVEPSDGSHAIEGSTQ